MLVYVILDLVMLCTFLPVSARGSASSRISFCSQKRSNRDSISVIPSPEVQRFENKTFTFAFSLNFEMHKLWKIGKKESNLFFQNDDVIRHCMNWLLYVTKPDTPIW